MIELKNSCLTLVLSGQMKSICKYLLLLWLIILETDTYSAFTVHCKGAAGKVLDAPPWIRPKENMITIVIWSNIEKQRIYITNLFIVQTSLQNRNLQNNTLHVETFITLSYLYLESINNLTDFTIIVPILWYQIYITFMCNSE